MSRTVLIVDDHGPYRVAARAMLEAEGFIVVGEAGTGSEALAKADALRPAIVLLDVQLPDQDGFAVAERMAEGVHMLGGAHLEPLRAHLRDPAPGRAGAGVHPQERADRVSHRGAAPGVRLSRSTVLQAAATLAVVGVGLAGFRVGYAAFQGRDAVLGLLTGIAVATLGLAAWRRSGASRVGPLLVLAGIAWFPSDWRFPPTRWRRSMTGCGSPTPASPVTRC